MNEFTKGTFHACEYYTEMKDVKHPNHSVESGDGLTADLIENFADAVLYATAGTTATKLAEAGYDAVKVLEVLPKIMKCIKVIDNAGVYADASKLLKQCRGE